ncbi:MAG TPA: universal stress protein [Candidatus Kapabacteria bacterium]|nr:universal stress protein [Candidatus Kapabacteria bacterium]
MKVRPAKNSGEVVMEINRRDEPLLNEATTAPFRMKKILVPVDFSECSKKALQYAIPLAQQHLAELQLLYVSPSPSYSGGEYGVIDYSTLNAELCASGEKRLETFVRDEIAGKVQVDTMVRSGSVTAEILDVAKTLPADIIVISTHGYSGLKHVLLGSVAEHVVRHAPCPVLVVREKEHEFVS